jgi:hypothetical protein
LFNEEVKAERYDLLEGVFVVKVKSRLLGHFGTLHASMHQGRWIEETVMHINNRKVVVSVKSTRRCSAVYMHALPEPDQMLE